MNQDLGAGTLTSSESAELVRHYSQPHYQRYVLNLEAFVDSKKKVMGLHPSYQEVIDDMVEDELILIRDETIAKITDRGLALLRIFKARA